MNLYILCAVRKYFIILSRQDHGGNLIAIFSKLLVIKRDKIKSRMFQKNLRLKSKHSFLCSINIYADSIPPCDNTLSLLLLDYISYN